MKNTVLIILLFYFGFNSFGQQDSTSLKKDTSGYKLELKEFYNFLTSNYDQYKMIDFHNSKVILLLEKECEKILSIIYSKSEYVDQEMAVYSTTTYSYTYYDVGGKNCPKVYDKIVALHKICKKMETISNEKKWRKLNAKMMKKINEILKYNSN